MGRPYAMTMSTRALLPEHERRAVQAALIELKKTLAKASGERPSETAVAVELGFSQTAINKAIRHADVGPSVARRLCEYLRYDSMDELVAKYVPEHRDTAPFKVTIPRDRIPANARALIQNYPADLQPMLELAAVREGADRSPEFWRASLSTPQRNNTQPRCD